MGGYRLDAEACANLDDICRREWLLVNGIGGYAMGTPSGINTRRYHGLLVAAVTPPTDRMVLLAAIEAFIQGDGERIGISANQYPDAIYPEGHRHLTEFYAGRHVEWRYRADGLSAVKRLVMHAGENACTLEFENVGSQPFTLTLRPLVCHKPHHENFRVQEGYPMDLSIGPNRSQTIHRGITLHLVHPRANCVPVTDWYYRIQHRREGERGLDPVDDLYCPIELSYVLHPGEKAVIAAGTDPGVEPIQIPAREPEWIDPIEELKDAVAKFVVSTESRVSIIAGYPWFTDWGRDTMISLPGTLLCRGKTVEAKAVLRDYASQCRDGLIPNRFAESGSEPDYNTVDATLWYVNAIYKTLTAEWDERFAAEMAVVCQAIFERHCEGTAYGIKVDPEDGLLLQGEPGVQLTWMDVKIGDWVVTPRTGKPVEVNGLWINALGCMVWLRKKLGLDASAESECYERATARFEGRFWQPEAGFYKDTVDPDDLSMRPNQVIAMALPFNAVDPDHAKTALIKVRERLLTPRGLRTLDPAAPSYRGRFEGGMAELDAAYHQGTAWPWLLGSYASAAAKFGDDPREPLKILSEARAMLAERGFGGISEVYDGDVPQRGNGCPWQAWSAAEILRAWMEDVCPD